MIKETISAHRLKKRRAYRTNLLLKDPNRRKFWRFVKGQMSSGRITALRGLDGNIEFEQEKIEEVVMSHFAERFSGEEFPPVSSSDSLDGSEISDSLTDDDENEGSRKFPSDHFDSYICEPYSYVELEKILADLPAGKASGYDR